MHINARQVIGETLGLRVLDAGITRETMGITLRIGDNLCHKTEGIGKEQLDSDTLMKQHT